MSWGGANISETCEIGRGERAITDCGGGIAATLDALALRVAGHPNVAVHDDSLNEWSADPEMPMETGEA